MTVLLGQYCGEDIGDSNKHSIPRCGGCFGFRRLRRFRFRAGRRDPQCNGGTDQYLYCTAADRDGFDGSVAHPNFHRDREFAADYYGNRGDRAEPDAVGDGERDDNLDDPTNGRRLAYSNGITNEHRHPREHAARPRPSHHQHE